MMAPVSGSASHKTEMLRDPRAWEYMFEWFEAEDRLPIDMYVIESHPHAGYYNQLIAFYLSLAGCLDAALP